MKPYHVFLAGPWERFTSIPYKSLIKNALPNLRFFDPETRDEEQKDGHWFNDNFMGILASSVMVVLVPEFPFPTAAQEAGMFYVLNMTRTREPIQNLIYIWPPEIGIGKDWGQEGCHQMGRVVSTVDEAIYRIRLALEEQDRKELTFEESVLMRHRAQKGEKT